MTINEAIRGVSSSRCRNTSKAMEGAARIAFGALGVADVRELTPDLVGSLWGRLMAAGYSDASARLSYWVVKVIVNHAHEKGQIDDGSAFRLVRALERTMGPQRRRPTPTGLSESDAIKVGTHMGGVAAHGPNVVHALLASRDAAVIGSMICGLQREHVSRLSLNDYAAGRPDKADAVLRSYREVRGRHNIPVWPIRDLLNHWVSVRGDKPGGLFNPIGRSGLIQHEKGLSPQSTYVLRQRWFLDGAKIGFMPSCTQLISYTDLTVGETFADAFMAAYRSGPSGS